MFPLLSILIALMVGLSGLEKFGGGGTDPDLALSLLVFLLTSGTGLYLTRRAVRRTLADESRSPGPLLQAEARQRLLIVIGYGVLVYAARWPAVVNSLGIGDWILVDEIVTLLPLVILLYVSFHVSWSAEHALDLHDFSRREFVVFQSRQFLLPVTPILVFLLGRDLVTTGSANGVEWVAEAKIAAESYAYVSWITVGLLLFALYCLMPFVMRWLWKLEPMPEGPLRDRLMEFSGREGFRARDLLVWPTGGNVLNAAVIGIAAPFRYVLMTDALLTELEPDEVEAVFAHEVGHAKHNHLLKFFFFILGQMLFVFLLVTAFQRQLAWLLGESDLALLAFMIGILLFWFGLLMGFISRRFEQQADVYGALSIGRVRGHGAEEGDDHPFVRALTRIGMQLGDIRENKGWRHFSLGSRIEFVRRFLFDEEERRLYRRRIASLMLFFFGLLGALGIAAAATIPSQIRDGRRMATEKRVQWFQEQGRLEDAAWEHERLFHLHLEQGPERHRRIWLEMNTWYDTAGNTELDPFSWIQAMTMLARGYLALDMARAARYTVDEVFRGTGGFPLPPLVEAALLELMGHALAAEGRPRGARLAFEDALALVPPEPPGTEEFVARIRAALNRLDPPRNR
ncbi:MAG: M48 family metallopeptidase [Planctomycetota bacterium]